MNPKLRKGIIVGAIVALSALNYNLISDKYSSKAEAEPSKEEVLRDNEIGKCERPLLESIVKHPKTIGDKKENILPDFFYDRFHQAPEYTRERKSEIDGIVLHTTEGSGLGAENWLTTKDTTPASAHYLVMENGEVVGLVNDLDTAYHCRGHNDQTIGIEFAGYHNKNLNESQVKAGRRLVSNLMKRYNLPKSSIKAHSELDPSRRKDPGEKNMELILSGLN